MSCEHKKTKKNFPHGKKSGADKHCKDCGEVVTNKMIKDKKRKRNSH